MLKGDKSHRGKMHGEESGGPEDMEKVLWWLQGSRGQVLSVWQHSEWPSTAPQCSSPTEGVKPRLQLPCCRGRRVCAPWLSPTGSPGCLMASAHSWAQLCPQTPNTPRAVPGHRNTQVLTRAKPQLLVLLRARKPNHTAHTCCATNSFRHAKWVRGEEGGGDCLKQRLLPPAAAACLPITSWSSFLTIYIIPILPASHNDTF